MRLESGWLGQDVKVVIDRPAGSSHHKYPDIVYPINYGFVPGTLAADGEPIDAYVLGLTDPRESVTGTVIALVRREDDTEDKLVVSTDAEEWSSEAIRQSVDFQEKWFRYTVELWNGTSP